MLCRCVDSSPWKSSSHPRRRRRRRHWRIHWILSLSITGLAKLNQGNRVYDYGTVSAVVRLQRDNGIPFEDLFKFANRGGREVLCHPSVADGSVGPGDTVFRLKSPWIVRCRLHWIHAPRMIRQQIWWTAHDTRPRAFSYRVCLNWERSWAFVYRTWAPIRDFCDAE